MCGIFGSLNFATYSKLFKANRVRGNFASGSMYVGASGEYMRKDDDKYLLTGENYRCNLFNYNMFLGHTQSPTGSKRDFSPETTHPFECDKWVVAHNGIIENFEQLKIDHLPTHSNPVDSSIIPALLDSKYIGDDIYCISEVMPLLTGTFSCWIYSGWTRNIYLVRSGSTLFCDYKNSNFSSIEVPDICTETLSENIVYQLTTEGLTNVGNFAADSPFFII